MKLLQEDYRVNEGLIEFESEGLAEEIATITNSGIVALVGDYGTGKSTALHGIASIDKDKDHLWLQFDAWRYPERKGLWDGLIIEIARQIGDEKKTKRKVDGNKSALGRWGSVLGEIFVQASDALPDINIKDKLLDSEATSEAAERTSRIANKASELFGRSPAKRVYDFEQILSDLLCGVKQGVIYLVAEDIDRSGADGITFLETLNFFLKNNEALIKSKKQIIVIAPIATSHYENNQTSYYKCVDIVITYKPKVKSTKTFVENIFSENFIADQEGTTIQNLDDFFSDLLSNQSYKINIRTLKSILRQTHHSYIQLSANYDAVDWKVVLVIESLRASRLGDSSWLERSYKENKIGAGSIFAAMLLTVHMPNMTIFTNKYANSTNPKDRILNRRMESYTFIKYTGQSEKSVWVGSTAGFNSQVSGFIADYYKT